MSKHDGEMRALFKRYKGDALHALLAACGLRFEGMPPPPFEYPCYRRPATRELTDHERAMLAEVDAQLLAQRPCPTSKQTAEEWGKISPRTRNAVTEGASEEIIEKYRKYVEDYYKGVAVKGTEQQ